MGLLEPLRVHGDGFRLHVLLVFVWVLTSLGPVRSRSRVRDQSELQQQTRSLVMLVFV